MNRITPRDAAIGIAFAGALAAGGCASVASVETGPRSASLPFEEDFEAPAIVNFTMFRAGQAIHTQQNLWVVESGAVDVVNASKRADTTVAWNGEQAVDLAGSPGAGVISSTFRTVPGQMYRLTFRYARNNQIGNTPARATVEVMGAGPLLREEVTHEAAAYTYDRYQTFTRTFTAEDTQSILRFSSWNAGISGVVIDGIRIEPAAEASLQAHAGAEPPDTSRDPAISSPPALP